MNFVILDLEWNSSYSKKYKGFMSEIIEFGAVRIQLGGGMGGHNGLRSVKQHLGTENFGRLRIGVGRPPSGIRVADFVLGRFSEIEEKQLPEILEKAVAAALEYIAG